MIFIIFKIETSDDSAEVKEFGFGCFKGLFFLVLFGISSERSFSDDAELKKLNKLEAGLIVRSHQYKKLKKEKKAAWAEVKKIQAEMNQINKKRNQDRFIAQRLKRKLGIKTKGPSDEAQKMAKKAIDTIELAEAEESRESDQVEELENEQDTLEEIEEEEELSKTQKRENKLRNSKEDDGFVKARVAERVPTAIKKEKKSDSGFSIFKKRNSKLRSLAIKAAARKKEMEKKMADEIEEESVESDASQSRRNADALRRQRLRVLREARKRKAQSIWGSLPKK